jgi:hypothetical protein
VNCPNWHPCYGGEELGVDVEHTVRICNAIVDKSFFKARIVDEGHSGMEICENFTDRGVAN